MSGSEKEACARACTLWLGITTFLPVLVVASCVARPTTATTNAGSLERGQLREVRVALQTNARRVTLSATGAWIISDNGGLNTVVQASGVDAWIVEPAGQRLLRANRADAMPTAARPGPITARPMDSRSLIIVNERRYRGEIAIVPTDTGMLVVNRLDVESYLRGVVPLEIGTRRVAGEHAAIAAQAVAARSYTHTRLGAERVRAYDLLATVFDQVYGGADAETPLADEAVLATRGLVLTFRGRVVSAPYHSTCGGSTAAASEVWRSPDEPFLRPVSDRIPGTERYYCDVSPRFNWTRTFDAHSLSATLGKYLGAYTSIPARGVGITRNVTVDGNTPSGRVRSLGVLADGQRYALRGNDIRFVFRTPGGEILNSTYFTVHAEHDAAGAVSRLTLRGAGNGHGIGMCQWGAIGRARAGQDFRTILGTYYPGTAVATVY
ncbi:MAG: SpoIID/LytB domain-containing protein [Anaerolineae bacterium]|nr:SpoIID/LytB domain-containing protein [Gemmatimonadaceae bacterium]